MTNLARVSANRANARLSTGPRTNAGKAQVARNARRHGLAVAALRDPTLAGEIAALARQIAGADAPARRYEAACRIAAAQLDVLRVRRARRELIAAAALDPELPVRLAAIDRYERSALSRRKSAIRDFDAAR